MSVEQLLGLAIPILIILFIIGALVLLVLGVRRNNSRLFMSGIVLAAVSLIATIREYPETGITLSALSAIAIAVFAGLTLFENRLLRQANETTKNRDIKENILNDIIRWLKDLEEHIFHSSSINILEEFQIDADLISKIGIPQDNIESLRRAARGVAELDSLRNEIREGEYNQKLILELDRSLSILLETIVRHMKNRKILILENAKLPLTPVPKSVEELKTTTEVAKDSPLSINAFDIRESVSNAIDKAIEIKISLL